MLRAIELARGQIKNAIAAATNATTTSDLQRANGLNAIILYLDITGSGEWTVKLQGATSSSGTFMDLYDHNGNQMSMGSLAADRARLFIGIPEHFKIVATEDSGTATIQVDYELLTV